MAANPRHGRPPGAPAYRMRLGHLDGLTFRRRFVGLLLVVSVVFFAGMRAWVEWGWAGAVVVFIVALNRPGLGGDSTEPGRFKLSIGVLPSGHRWAVELVFGEPRAADPKRSGETGDP